MTDWLDRSVFRPDLVHPIAIHTVLERAVDGTFETTPSDIITALLYFATQPDMVTLVRADLLYDDQEDLYGHEPSLYWHQIPRTILVEALDPAMYHRWRISIPYPDEDPGLEFSLNDRQAGWLTITDRPAVAEGTVGLGLSEEFLEIHVQVEQVQAFLNRTYELARRGA